MWHVECASVDVAGADCAGDDMAGVDMEGSYCAGDPRTNLVMAPHSWLKCLKILGTSPESNPRPPGMW
jgi:hypothetical protein